MDFKVFDLVIFLFLTSNHETLAFTEHVGFNKTDCDVYRHYLYNDADKYIVEWSGDAYPKFCDLQFEVKSEDYGLCSYVTRFKMSCYVDLKFYWGLSKDIERYSCQNSLPIKYCSGSSLLYMNLEPYEKAIMSTDSSLRIEVYPKYNKDSSNLISLNGGAAGIVIGLILLIILIVYCIIRYKRNQANQANTGNNAIISRQDGNVHVVLTNTNQQGQYQPGPTQQYPPAGQQYPSYPPQGYQYQSGLSSGQQYQSGPPPGQHYSSGPPPGQQYPSGSTAGQQYPSGHPSGQQYLSGHPLEQQYLSGPPPGQQYPVYAQPGQQCSSYSSTGRQHSSNPTPEQQYPSGPPPGQQYASGPLPEKQYQKTSPSAPPKEKQFPPSDDKSYIQNPSLGGVSSPYNCPGQQESSAPPSYSSVMQNK